MAKFLGSVREDSEQDSLGLGGAVAPKAKAPKTPKVLGQPLAQPPGTAEQFGPVTTTPARTLSPSTPTQEAVPLVFANAEASAGRLTKAEQTAINAQNWAVEAAKPIDNLDEMFNYAKVKELQDYDYDLTNMQALQGHRGPEERRVKVEDVESAAMTWEQYDALSEDQKKAVDFNTLLVKAREQDLKRAHVPWKAERVEKYNARLNDIFGPGGNSETLAFSVAKLLDGMDFKAVGQDVDEFLSLERAIDAKELATLDLKLDTPAQGETNQRQGMVAPDPADPGYSNYSEINSPENKARLDSAAIEAASTYIREKMTDPSQTIASDFEATMFPGSLDLSGYTPEELKKLGPEVVPYGFGSQFRDAGVPEDQLTMDRWFTQAWANLQNPTFKEPLKWVNAEMEKWSFSPEDRREFFKEMHNRTMSQMQYGSPATEGARTPDEIRKELGLGD